LDEASGRDTKAIHRIVNGMMKIVYPHGEISDDELKEIVGLAVEYRQFVCDQNYSISKENIFNKKIEFSIY
ncbi:MAG: BREX system Lon protease-like protein BrxL, partial [Fusobacteriaceae bacterium]